MRQFENEENDTLILSTAIVWYQLSPLKAHLKRMREARMNKSKTIWMQKSWNFLKYNRC